ncbi:MAG: 1-deoxy-D-xylulose-5-phosphate reductoisomerase, partial [Aeromicrobium sp.]
IDGSTMAQASPPDMKLPIALGLDWPRRVRGATTPCDWEAPTSWEFYPLDEVTFPAVSLARAAGEFGRTAPAVYNAANEECVAAFMAGSITFVDIVKIVGRVLTEHIGLADVGDFTLESVLAADAAARVRAQELISAGVSA